MFNLFYYLRELCGLLVILMKQRPMGG